MPIANATPNPNQCSLSALVAAARALWWGKSLQGNCGVGVSKTLFRAGYSFDGDRPKVGDGIVDGRVFDYGSGRWITAGTVGRWTGRTSNISNGTVAPASTTSAAASSCAKYFGHTLKMFGFMVCTGPEALLGGNSFGYDVRYQCGNRTGVGTRNPVPEASVSNLSSQPEGVIVVFGPALTRSLVNQRDGEDRYPVGGDGHAGHVGVLVRQGTDMVVVADGNMSVGTLDTVSNCIAKYEWAVGFMPTAEPYALTSAGRPAQTL